MKKQNLSRRQFVRRAVGAAVAVPFVHSSVAARLATGPNEKLNIAVVGAGNKGWHNVQQLAEQNMVAFCDVDTNYLDAALTRFPGSKTYRDYRRMLDKEHQAVDAVVVSTADHTHAPATSVALDLGKHVYCEKPLTHTVKEARAMARLAKKKGVATQMGTQIHAGDNYRRVVEVVQGGAIGKVSEVYSWCNKGWSDGRFQEGTFEVPKNLDWDLWLGPAASRPYSPAIHPANWRRFWEYGSGTFGDMACHVVDLPFWALDLKYPNFVQAEGPEVHPVGAPAWCKAEYHFPKGKETIKLYWSDGGSHFDPVKTTKDYQGKPLSSWGLGTLFVGDQGMLVADYGRYQLLPQDQFSGYEPPTPTIPKSMGHWNEWVHACKTGDPTTCNFDYSGALTETVLLGIVAFRAGEPVRWDADKLRSTNSELANRYVSKEYRKGFEIAGGV